MFKKSLACFIGLLGYAYLVFAQETLLSPLHSTTDYAHPPLISVIDEIRPAASPSPQSIRKWEIRKKPLREEVRVFIDPISPIEPDLAAAPTPRLMRDETNPVPDETLLEQPVWVVGRQLTLSETKKEATFTRSVTMMGGKGGALCSCVLFARTLVPALPYGLHNYQDKLEIINSHTPEVGHVVIMKSPSGLGHVAVIKSLNDDGSITIEEGNFRRCKRNIRTDMPDRMNIKGYFDPKK